MDYVDLYQVHRWDPNTPAEETMEALNDVVRAGKAWYLGARTMAAWQFALAWLLHKPGVTAPIIGATMADSHPDAIAATCLDLTTDEVTRLEQPYIPHPLDRG